MTPEADYTTSEGLLTEDCLKRLACYGMEYAKKKMGLNSLAAAAVASHDKVFEKYLAYIVFGRIVRLSAEALRDGIPHAVSVGLLEEMGLSINQKLAKSGTAELKSIDFSDHKTIPVMRQSFDTMTDDVDDLFTKLTRADIEVIGSLGSAVVPANPKSEPRPSTFVLE